MSRNPACAHQCPGSAAAALALFLLLGGAVDSARAKPALGFGAAIENPEAFDLEYGWRISARSEISTRLAIDASWQRLLVQEGGIEDWSSALRAGIRVNFGRDGAVRPYARIEALHYSLALGALDVDDVVIRPELGIDLRSAGAIPTALSLGLRARGFGVDGYRLIDDSPFAAVARLDWPLASRWSLSAEVEASAGAYQAFVGVAFGL